MKNMLSAQQIEALRLFAAANGRNWKSQLNTLWMNGAYNYAVLGGADPAYLQQVRNEFGPSWLVRFRLPKPEAAGDGFTTGLEITNGEFGMVCQIAHFMRFMFVESAPVPVTREERDALLNRYIVHCRREDMQRVSELRVSRGESPLPRSLTGK